MVIRFFAGNNRMDCLSNKVGDVDNYEKKFKEGKVKAASQVESFYNIATVTTARRAPGIDSALAGFLRVRLGRILPLRASVAEGELRGFRQTPRALPGCLHRFGKRQEVLRPRMRRRRPLAQHGSDDPC